MKTNCVLLLTLFLATPKLFSAEKESEGLKTEVVYRGLETKSGKPGNDPTRIEWVKDQGLGLFIHWSVDCPLGSVISHHLIGTTKDYQDRFFEEMPGMFYPKDFNPDDWARLAKLAGMKYVVFTTKHHAGFCMWDTKTTDFNIMNTPFKKDATRAIFDAFRKQGIAIGVYYSPEDFYYLYKQKVPIGRMQHPLHFPEKNPGLMAYDKSQLKELLSNYGKIDFIFFDGPAEGLKEYAWQLQPDIVVTRGQMNTPEQELPEGIMPG